MKRLSMFLAVMAITATASSALAEVKIPTESCISDDEVCNRTPSHEQAVTKQYVCDSGILRIAKSAAVLKGKTRGKVWVNNSGSENATFCRNTKLYMQCVTSGDEGAESKAVMRYTPVDRGARITALTRNHDQRWKSGLRFGCYSKRRAKRTPRKAKPAARRTTTARAGSKVVNVHVHTGKPARRPAPAPAPRVARGGDMNVNVYVNGRKARRARTPPRRRPARRGRELRSYAFAGKKGVTHQHYVVDNGEVTATRSGGGVILTP